MARNLAIDELRRTRDEAALEDAEALSAGQELDTALDVGRALGALPLEERETVVLHLNGGLSFREVSEITGRSLPAVYRCYRRALKSLEKMLKGDER